jgi:hypothetical protein
MNHDIPLWLIENPSETRPTEILVPLSLKIGPSWSHNTKKGHWYGSVVVDLPLDLQAMWECDHDHENRDDAWRCANDAALQLAEEAIEYRQLGRL